MGKKNKLESLIMCVCLRATARVYDIPDNPSFLDFEQTLVASNRGCKKNFFFFSFAIGNFFGFLNFFKLNKNRGRMENSENKNFPLLASLTLELVTVGDLALPVAGLFVQIKGQSTRTRNLLEPRSCAPEGSKTQGLESWLFWNSIQISYSRADRNSSRSSSSRRFVSRYRKPDRSDIEQSPISSLQFPLLCHTYIFPNFLLFLRFIFLRLVLLFFRCSKIAP